MKFRNFWNFIISNIPFDDVFTDWLSKRTVYLFCCDKIMLFGIMETCSPCFLPGGGGGTRKNFDRDARVTFLGLKFDKLFFFGSLKMKVISWG